MNTTTVPQYRSARRVKQEASLQAKDPQLRKLAEEHKQQEFFSEITPLLSSLKSYIKRRLRIAYLSLQIRTPAYTTGDILDEVLLLAYAHYKQRPKDLTLEQWLYRLANEVLEKRLHRQAAIDSKRMSLEDLEGSELRGLEEPITSDAEGEVTLVEDLDDGEYHANDFIPPASAENPEQILDRKETILQILYALSRVPERDRIVFELFAIEGFSKQEVAKMLDISPEEVERAVKTVRTEVLHELSSRRSKSRVERSQKAS